jgi:hypothetical protein
MTSERNPSPDVAGLVAFLTEAATYFERRPTHGEDMTHWSNVANSENCRRAATTLLSENTKRLEAEESARSNRVGWIVSIAAVRAAESRLAAVEGENARLSTTLAALGGEGFSAVTPLAEPSVVSPTPAAGAVATPTPGVSERGRG